MAVGWGYGANMLAKYLGEEAAATPVTAAVCMENPLDLEESTKFSGDIHGTAFDREMTNGFVQILKSNQLQSLMSGLTLGLSLVASIYLVGISLGFIQFSWATILSFDGSRTFLSNLASSLRILKLMMQCFGISLAVSFVEELLFRSWLQEEISVDLGFHRAAMLSGLAFSISHWSLAVIPGLWLLSLVLTGAKARCNGDLNLAIGIHAGLIAGKQIIKLGGQVQYGVNTPIWFIGIQTGDPFTGLIGVSVLGMLALLLYPWDYDGEERN